MIISLLSLAFFFILNVFLDLLHKFSFGFLFLQDRVQQSGTDGMRVQQFIQSLPRSYLHQRNDFSHLGINANAANSDDVSVISATAAVTVHNAQV